MMDTGDHSARDRASENARKALLIYHERGEAALLAYADGNFEVATDWIIKRTIAYHNFRAIDALALKLGCDITSAEDIRVLLQKCQTQNLSLEEAMRKISEKSKEQLSKLVAARRQISGYQVQADDTHFVQSA